MKEERDIVNLSLPFAGGIASGAGLLALPFFRKSFTSLYGTAFLALFALTGILLYLLIGIGMEACAAGNPVGILPVRIGFPAITIAEGLFFTNLGYNLGRVALGNLFTSGMIDRLIECTSMIGMLMMGALGNTYVHLTLLNEGAQSTLDSIIPGLLPLVAIFVIYYIMKNVTQQMQWISLGIIAVGLILALIGLLLLVGFLYLAVLDAIRKRVCGQKDE